MKSAPTILILKHRSVFYPEKIVSKKQGAKNRARIFFLLFRKRRGILALSKVQIASRKNMVQTLKKTRVDATLYLLKFQPLIRHQGAD